MSLDTSLSNSNIVWADVVSSIQTYLSYRYLKDETVENRKYTIPINTTYDFVYIDIKDTKVKTIMNGLPTKSNSPDVAFTDAVEYTGSEDEDYEEFRFAYHGKGILVETNNEEVTEGALILKVRVVFKAITDNVDKDIEDKLKQCYLYLYRDDIDSFYIALKALSEVKKNTIAANKETKLTVKKNYSVITFNR